MQAFVDLQGIHILLEWSDFQNFLKNDRFYLLVKILIQVYFVSNNAVFVKLFLLKYFWGWGTGVTKLRLFVQALPIQF